MNINPFGMHKSENINGINIYLSGIRRGADAIVWNTESGNMFMGKVNYIVDMWDYESEFIFRDEYGEQDYGRSREFDFFLPFFTDTDEYYVGIDINAECKDTKNIQSCRDYMKWQNDLIDEDIAFEDIVKPYDGFAKREQERKRHQMHRAIKHRMYEQRVARRNAKRGIA